MARYGATSTNPTKSASARGSYFRVSFKNTRETAQAVNGWELSKAQQYLSQVLEHQRAIPFRRYNKSMGRASQGKEFGVTKARWPVKSVLHIQSVIQNAAANAESKGLDATKLYISHIQVNKSPKQRRRTYRAHGRINKYESSPCHIELILSERAETVSKTAEKNIARLSSRQRGKIAAQKRISA